MTTTTLIKENFQLWLAYSFRVSPLSSCWEVYIALCKRGASGARVLHFDLKVNRKRLSSIGIQDTVPHWVVENLKAQPQ